MSGYYRGSVEERFWAKVDKRGPDECWPWTGSTGHKGYGRLLDENRTRKRAHRLSWEIANGRAVPDGMFVCHRCDNPPCCNPAHLWIGTAADNSRDMVAKGRANPGGMKTSSAASVASKGPTLAAGSLALPVDAGSAHP